MKLEIPTFLALTEAQKHKNENLEKLFSIIGNKVEMANLNKMAEAMTEIESGGESEAIGDVKSILAVLGERWRNIPFEHVIAEVYALIERAGE